MPLGVLRSQTKEPAHGRVAAHRPSRQLISLLDAANFLGVSEKTVRRYIADGRLPAYRIGGHRLLRVNEADLGLLIERVPTVGGVA